MFYTISTHDFFCIIRLRSNNLHPSSTSSLLLPPDNYKITYPYITYHIKQIFSMEGQITEGLVQFPARSIRVRVMHREALAVTSWVVRFAFALDSRLHARIPGSLRLGRSDGRKKPRQRSGGLKSMCFLLLKHTCVV